MADGGHLAPVAQGDALGMIKTRRKLVFVREMRADEADELGAVFFRAVHHGAARAYSEAQRDAWAPQAPTGAAWAARLMGQSTVVAEVGGRVRGFMSLSVVSGLLDLAFVEKDAQGSGAAEALYLVLENRARVRGVSLLKTDASHLARPFLERQGWAVLSAQTVVRAGVKLQNWRMEKVLS